MKITKSSFILIASITLGAGLNVHAAPSPIVAAEKIIAKDIKALPSVTNVPVAYQADYTNALGIFNKVNSNVASLMLLPAATQAKIVTTFKTADAQLNAVVKDGKTLAKDEAAAMKATGIKAIADEKKVAADLKALSKLKTEIEAEIADFLSLDPLL